MSFSTETDVSIILRAHDRASPEVQAAVSRVNGEWRKLRAEQQAITHGFELQHQSLVAGARALQSVGRVTNGLLNIYQNYNIQQLRISDANRTVRETQEALNRAMAEGDTEAVIEASEQHKQAMDDLKRAQDDATLAFVAYTTTALAQSSTIVTTVIPRIMQLVGALGLAGGSGVALTGALAGLTAGTAAGTAATGLGLLGAGAAGAAGGVPYGLGMSFGVTSLADTLLGTNFSGILAKELKDSDKALTGGIFGGLIDFMTGNKAQNLNKDMADISPSSLSVDQLQNFGVQYAEAYSEPNSPIGLEEILGQAQFTQLPEASSTQTPTTYSGFGMGGTTNFYNTYNYYGYDMDQLKNELAHSAESASVMN